MSEKVALSPLKSFRNRRGLSLDKASRLIGISKGYLSELEHDRAKPSLHIGMRIAHAYGASPSTLWPELGDATALDVLVDRPNLGPLAMLSERQRIDLAVVLLIGTGHCVTKESL